MPSKPVKTPIGFSQFKPVRAALVASGLALLGAGGASAGEWRLNVAACPDLREDRRDQRVDWSRHDRREDRRDARVVTCPASAWTYVKGPHERRHDRAPPRPREVIVYRDGRREYRDSHGALINLGVGLRLGL